MILFILLCITSIAVHTANANITKQDAILSYSSDSENIFKCNTSYKWTRQDSTIINQHTDNSIRFPKIGNQLFDGLYMCASTTDQQHDYIFILYNKAHMTSSSIVGYTLFGCLCLMTLILIYVYILKKR